MKIDTSKLKNKPINNTQTKSTSLSFSHIKHADNKPKEESTQNEMTKLKSFRSLKIAHDTPKPENVGVSLIFTDKKVYDLDNIIRDKRRDNANCPLILKVNDKDQNDREIVELITIMIVDNYLNADGSLSAQFDTDEDYFNHLQQNYPTEIHKIPNFNVVFDEYFNRYYPYYYNRVSNIQEGSISLDAIKEYLVNAYNYGYENILGEALTEYADTMVLNKPRIEYEMGTEQGPDDIVPDTSYLGLIVKDNKLFISNQGVPIPGQNGIPFAMINGEIVLNSDKNFELLTFYDYIELMQSTILMSNDCLLLESNDGSIMTANNDFGGC